ncbi:hypothetical protein [Spiroplasma endosymbiont of Atherix ibis]|uniref:hypothetical protein n=1 Tax=Spiroplasma endosymbiont of Atherix ibis TaxID=3066291 RepID=UPI0030D3565D
MHYIDIDWNEILVYKDQKVIHRESSMILRDLKNEKLLYIGKQAKEHLSDNINLLAIVPVESLQVTSIDDLNILLDYILKKLNIKQAYLVNRYCIRENNIKGKIDLIDVIDFIKIISNKEIYLEVRNLETNVFNLTSKIINYFDLGIIKILRYLNRFFYLNKNGLLNTSKTMKLFNDLSENKKLDIEIKEIDTGKNILIKNLDNKLLLENIDIFYKNLLNIINNSEFEYNENMSKLIKIYD